jgi:hypothetical protein
MIDSWIEQFQKLSSSEQNLFRKCVNGLLAKTFIVSEVYDEVSAMMKSNPEYRFIERSFELIFTYLSFAGWNLIKVRNLGVIYVECVYEYNRLQLNSMTTLFIYTLRLLYDEEREKLTLRTAIPVTTYDVVSRLLTFSTLKRKPSEKDQSEAFRLLSRYNVIQKISGTWEEPECKFLIFPSIMMVLPNDTIGKIYSSLEADINSGNQIGIEELDQEVIRGEDAL